MLSRGERVQPVQAAASWGSGQLRSRRSLSSVHVIGVH